MHQPTQFLAQLEARGIQRVRLFWCDLHGHMRSKTLMPAAAARALADGIGMAGTQMLKDSADRTAFPVFDGPALEAFPGLHRFAHAANITMKVAHEQHGATALPWLPVLPWDPTTALLRVEASFADGEPVSWDTRRVLQAALERLQSRGLGLRCGLEIEFHIYKLTQDASDPMLAAWPGPAPQVELIHPGYRLLSDELMERCSEPMRIVEHTALGLGLPLQSLEVEFGPSQVEAVFDVRDALVAADSMVLFRNLVRQALRRAGYYATFVCRPPFANIMSSGWHLHQSLVSKDGTNAVMRQLPDQSFPTGHAENYLSPLGASYLAGLLGHAPAMAAFATPTLNGYERYRPNALAPQSAVWGVDNRGAMLRVIGAPGNPATRIENRLGEPCANPYLYMASQIHAGLDGIDRALSAPAASNSPYNSSSAPTSSSIPLPASLGEALDALDQDSSFASAFGPGFAQYYTHIKRQEIRRHDEATDKEEFMRREYFARY